MASIMGSIFGETTGVEADKTLGLNAVAGAGAMANAYLVAALGASTPEVKRLYSDYLTQVLVGHQGLTELNLGKGWANPYQEPESQLQVAYRDSQEILTSPQ